MYLIMQPYEYNSPNDCCFYIERTTNLVIFLARLSLAVLNGLGDFSGTKQRQSMSLAISQRKPYLISQERKNTNSVM